MCWFRQHVKVFSVVSVIYRHLSQFGDVILRAEVHTVDCTAPEARAMHEFIVVTAADLLCGYLIQLNNIYLLAAQHVKFSIPSAEIRAAHAIICIAIIDTLCVYHGQIDSIYLRAVHRIAASFACAFCPDLHDCMITCV